MMTASSPGTAAPARPAAKPTRDWLVRMFFSPLTGMKFRTYSRLLRENRFAIDPPYLPKAGLLAAAALATSRRSRIEDARFGGRVRDAQIRPPLFILGHWRSGTTLLHNLISVDERFTYPDLYQVTNPHTFLLAGPAEYAFFERFLPKKRVMDNMTSGAAEPAEDEFATRTMTTRSPYTWAFPRNEAKYDRYLTFRDVPDAEVAEWSEALVLFLKKLSVLKDRPIALKSPTHTARVRLLLKLFPDARFLHIRRDPYAVFQSFLNTQRRALQKRGHLQGVTAEGLETRVIERYTTLYDAYLEDRRLIPGGQLHELTFEDLERDPIGQLRVAYEAIGLPDFEVAAPAIEAHLSGQAGYRKNEFRPMDPALKRLVAESFGRYFEEWNYPID